jgi:TonB family protein
MPHKHNDIKHGVDPEQIRRYLAGELDDKAMHILERQALEDPFLAEALDGFTGYAADQTFNLDDLNSRLEKRVAPAKERRMIVYFRWAAAAAVLLVAGIGVMKLWQTPVKQELVREYVRKDSVTVAPPAAITDESGQSLAERADKQPAKIKTQKKSSPTVVSEDRHSWDDIVERPRVAEEIIVVPKPVAPVPEPVAPSAKLVAPSPMPVASAPMSVMSAPMPVASKPALAASSPAAVTTPAADMLAVPPTPLKKKARIEKQSETENQLQDKSGFVNTTSTAKDSLNRFYAFTPAPKGDANLAVSSRSYSAPANEFVTNTNTAPGLVNGKLSVLSIPRRNATGKVRLLQGKVTSENDSSVLSGATVLVAGTNKATVTDQYGHFAILVDSTADVQLDVAYLGYERKKLWVGNKNENLKIALLPGSSSLNEVVVTGYGVRMKKSLGYSVTTVQSSSIERGTSPKPKRGFKRYNRYIARHVRYPAAAGNTKGFVRLTFTVKANGTLTNFKVIRPLQPDCDTEAIRVVKEGPAWKPASDGSDKLVVVDVPFAP